MSGRVQIDAEDFEEALRQLAAQVLAETKGPLTLLVESADKRWKAAFHVRPAKIDAGPKKPRRARGPEP